MFKATPKILRSDLVVLSLCDLQKYFCFFLVVYSVAHNQKKLEIFRQKFDKSFARQILEVTLIHLVGG
jgi:hypothetical protein